MAVRVAINGFGRIGRSVYRIGAERKDIKFVAINDVTDNSTLVYLLRFDTVMGNFEHEVRFEKNIMATGTQETHMLTEPDPEKLPWKEMNIDIVIEATGRFRTSEDAGKHLTAGAKKVLLTVPPKGTVDAMVVLGVNDDILKPEHRIISNASCTTNCLAPIAKVLHDNFGIEYGTMTTVHAYTNDQRLSDFYHTDLRRARAANENIIPTTTGAARAVGKILPELDGRLDGMSMRVPIPDGSLVDLVTLLKKNVTADEVNQIILAASQKKPLKGIIQYSEDPIVSSDIIKNPYSCVFDAPFTRVLFDNFVKTISWYDNEWGYSNRIIDLLNRIPGL